MPTHADGRRNEERLDQLRPILKNGIRLNQARYEPRDYGSGETGSRLGVISGPGCVGHAHDGGGYHVRLLVVSEQGRRVEVGGARPDLVIRHVSGSRTRQCASDTQDIEAIRNNVTPSWVSLAHGRCIPICKHRENSIPETQKVYQVGPHVKLGMLRHGPTWHRTALNQRQPLARRQLRLEFAHALIPLRVANPAPDVYLCVRCRARSGRVLVPDHRVDVKRMLTLGRCGFRNEAGDVWVGESTWSERQAHVPEHHFSEETCRLAQWQVIGGCQAAKLGHARCWDAVVHHRAHQTASIRLEVD